MIDLVLLAIIAACVVSGFMAGLHFGEVRADRIQRHLRRMVEEEEDKRKQWPRLLDRMKTGGLN